VSSSRLNVKKLLPHFHGIKETLEVSTQNRELEKEPTAAIFLGD